MESHDFCNDLTQIISEFHSNELSRSGNFYNPDQIPITIDNYKDYYYGSEKISNDINDYVISLFHKNNLYVSDTKISFWYFYNPVQSKIISSNLYSKEILPIGAIYVYHVWVDLGPDIFVPQPRKFLYNLRKKFPSGSRSFTETVNQRIPVIYYGSKINFIKIITDIWVAYPNEPYIFENDRNIINTVFENISKSFNVVSRKVTKKEIEGTKLSYLQRFGYNMNF